VDEHDKPVRRCQLRRSQVIEYFAKLTPCLVGMEACAGSHYWARRLSEFGHTVKLMAPQHVKGYVQGNKNDANDASAICEAVSRPRMRFVPVKSVEQQDIQAVHRVRSELIRQRTAKINQIRGLLGEYGIAIAQGTGAVRGKLPELIEDGEVALSIPFRELLGGLHQDLVYLDTRVLELDKRIDRIARSSPVARNLMKREGIGSKTATALLASIGNGQQFSTSREVSANHGMVPAQHCRQSRGQKRGPLESLDPGHLHTA
jgi:transposase